MKITSILKDIYQSTQTSPRKIQKPVVIQFPVNDICNSRCQMCRIWEKKLDYQITPSELSQVLSSPIFSEVRGVGINGGEPTLRNDLAELVDILFEKLPKLYGISLITNAYNANQVMERIEQVGQVVSKHEGYYDVMISLDGVGEVHDRVRGREGNFQNAMAVIDFVKDATFISKVRLGCTVIKENVYGVHDLLDFALSKDLYIKYRVGIPHQRLYSDDLVKPFSFSFEEKVHFAVFLENLIRHYEESPIQQMFYRSLIDQLMYHRPRAVGCDFQYRGATLSARGEMLYCAVESKTLGSALEEDPEKLYMNNEGHLAQIVHTKCDDCMHDYVGLPSTSVLLAAYAKKGVHSLNIPVNSLKNSRTLSPIISYNRRRKYFKRSRQFETYANTNSKIQPAGFSSKTVTDKYKILVCGWYGTETLGDKAILGGIVRSLQGILPGIELHLASFEPYISNMTVLQMQELKGCQIHSIHDAIIKIPDMDIVIFGGGPLMAIPSIVEMRVMFQKARTYQIPTIIAGCGVGPLGPSYLNKEIQELLACASYRIYRDEKSLNNAKSLGIDVSNDFVAEDPAFTWLTFKDVHNSNNAIQKKSPKQPVLLLGLREWPYREYAHRLSYAETEKINMHYEQEVVKALELLLDSFSNLKIVPFPMCTNHFGGDDRFFYRRLFRDNTKLQDAICSNFLDAEAKPAEAIPVFQSASAILTMRYHSLVFALGTGSPPVAIDYTLGQGKVYSLANQHNVPQMSLDKLTRNFVYENIGMILDRSLQKPQYRHQYLNSQAQPRLEGNLKTIFMEMGINHD